MPRRNNMEFDTQKYPGAWKKILHYCRKYNILMIIAILAAIGGTIATLSGPDRLQEVTDAIAEGLTGEIDIEHIRNVIIILGGIYLSGALLNLVQTQIMAYVTQMVSKQLRSDISRKINRLPMAYFGKTTTGDVLSRVTNDVDTLGQSLNQSVGTLVSAVGERQPNLLHPCFQSLQTSFGYLLIGHAIALDVPHFLGEAHEFWQTVLHGAAIVGHRDRGKCIAVRGVRPSAHTVTNHVNHPVLLLAQPDKGVQCPCGSPHDV